MSPLFSLVISMSASCLNRNTFRQIKGVKKCEWSQLGFPLTAGGDGAVLGWLVQVSKKKVCGRDTEVFGTAEEREHVKILVS